MKRPLRPLDQLNVVPLIDVMLVLLAVVLTTATFIAQGELPLTLPKAESSDDRPADARATLTIGITAEGRYLLDGREAPVESLLAEIAALDRSAHVRLEVDAQARFAAFVRVIDALKARGITDARIHTLKAPA